MKVKDLMTTNVICAQPDSPIITVASLLMEHRIHALPVAELGSLKLMGIVTETDLVLKDECSRYLNQGTLKYELDVISRKRKTKDYKFKQVLNVSVIDIMSKNCISVSPDIPLDELILTFRKTQFHSLPVVQPDNILMGIITLSDILKLY
jgi:acetoin utilization protein AcuB